MKTRARKKVDATFNMSSMTDIVFLLLIFFIVLSTFVTPPGVAVDLPKAGAGPDSTNPKITVSINVDQKYFLDKTEMTYDGLLAELKTRLNPGDNQPAIKLAADGNIPLEKGVALFADIKKLGYRKVVIATQPKQD